jgi:hypothetical protein
MVFYLQVERGDLALVVGSPLFVAQGLTGQSTGLYSHPIHSNEEALMDFEIAEDTRTHCEHDGDEHDPDYCCGCAHFHLRWIECPTRGEPCGDYRCCVN